MMRDMQDWLDGYSLHHQNPINQLLHWLCVPPIVWSVIALFWVIPVPMALAQPGAWAVLTIVVVFFWYWRQSRRLAIALLITFATLAFFTHFLYKFLGATRLCYLALSVFVVAWIGQFIGHHFEQKRPSFLTNVFYLLIAPAWLMEKLLRKLGIPTSFT